MRTSGVRFHMEFCNSIASASNQTITRL